MKFKKLPQWVKTLGLISIILLALLLFLTIFISLTAKDLGILAAVVFAIYILIILGMWGLGFLNRYLIVKKKKWIANLISIPIPSFLVIYFTWAFTWQMTYHPEQAGTFSQNAFFIIPLIIVMAYFVVTLIMINKKN
jgi:hypothetical protein